MKNPHEIRKLHEKIQEKLFFMLPEKWNSLYLYASVIDILGGNETGEMFFYYFPKGILRKKPVNVYQIPAKFDIDEERYFEFANDLYNEIKKLREVHIENKEEAWSNITIVIEDLKYKAIYGYDDLNSEEFNIEERRLIWLYKYLRIPYAGFNKKEKEIIDRYEKSKKSRETIFELPIYIKQMNKNIENIKDLEKKSEYVTEDKIEEMEFKKTHLPKSQILSIK